MEKVFRKIAVNQAKKLTQALKENTLRNTGRVPLRLRGRYKYECRAELIIAILEEFHCFFKVITSLK